VTDPDPSNNTATVSNTVTPATATVSGVVFADLNNNGRQEPFETGVPGVFVTLTGTDALGRPVSLITTTAANGSYSFTGVPPGNYSLMVVPPSEYFLGQASLGGQNSTIPGELTSVSVTPGQAVTEANFGLIPAGPMPGFPGDMVPPVVNPPEVPPTIVGKIDLLSSNLLLSSTVTSTLTPDPSLSADAQFVNNLYHNILTRAPATAEVNLWTDQLLGGVSRQAVATAIWNSMEHREEEVNALYLTFFHRPADAGAVYWVDCFMAGANEDDVAAALMTSPEYLANHPDIGSFVTGLYVDVFGRAPDQAGMTFWEGMLQSGMNRETAARLVLTSQETDMGLLSLAYQNYLGRPADPTSRYWLSVFGAGATPEDVLTAILASQEYYDKQS
jgi:hypothetical protein